MAKEKHLLLIRGLKFGMMLQLAVGPICLLVLNTASNQGFFMALPLILAVALADASYVALSCLGASAVISRPGIKAAVRAAGSIVLVLFGLEMLLTALGVSFLPGVRLFSVSLGEGAFLRGLALTLSNPLTILFWSGMLSAKVAENNWGRAQLAFFASGCVLATVLFLAAVAALGSTMGLLLPGVVIRVMNGAVGALLVLFGINLAFRNRGGAEKESREQD